MMMTAKVSLAASLVALSLVACAATTDSTEGTPTEETASDLTASQCKGILPHVCEVCADRTTKCAHWVVKDKKCEVEICPALPTKCIPHVCPLSGEAFDLASCTCAPLPR